jgi:hypothetical protein
MRPIPIPLGRSRRPSSRRARTSFLMASLLVTSLVVGPSGSVQAGAVATAPASSAALAAFAPPASTQFDMDGFLQAATLGGPGTGPGAGAHQGGTLTLDNQVVVVPSETIVILPANALTWQELFAQAPAPYGPTQTGMAITDIPRPLYTYEVHVVGNRVGDTYIAGLIDIAQQGLNSGAGYINFINYATGDFYVGGPIGTQAGARVQLNDPTGRYGRKMSPDPRFTVDADNPTISAGTGFPMCIPREAPGTVNADGTVGDVLCPEGNRPLDATGNYAISIQTNDPRVACTDTVNLLPAGCSLTGVGPDVFPRARDQAPMEVGDYVTFAGTLITDGTGTYISAHTVTNNAAIFTWPGTNPAYILTDTTLIGTGGLTILGAGEATVRTRFEGMSTDPSRGVHLYGIDLNPLTGATTDRDWGTIGVDPGPPGGAVKGRWRFRPPCAPFGTVVTKPDKQCVMNQAGTFLPPTREVRAVIEGLQSQNPATPGALTSANGLFYGQYHAPILTYIFPENLPGTPMVPNNFEAIDFLTCGGYTSAAGTLVGQLNPWPGAATPTCAAAATAPVANAGGPYTVASGSTVTLAGTATGSTPLTFAWATPSAGTLSSTSIGNPVYTAPQVSVSTTVNLSLTVTNSAGTSSATATVTVSPASAPTVAPITAQAVDSGASGTLAVSGSDPNVPASTPLTFSVTQSGTVALTGLTVSQNGPTGANIGFTAPTGVLTATDVTLSVTATNAAGVASAPVTGTITVNPPAATCIAPVASAGGTYTVNSGGTVTLAGSATGTTPLTYLWTGTPGTFSDATLSNPVYTAPAVTTTTTVSVSLTATNACGANTASSTITVNAALPPTVSAVAPITLFSGANGSFTLTGTDPNNPGTLPLTFAVAQSGTPALPSLVVTQSASGTGATVTFTAPTLPVNTVTSAVITLSITATNNLGQVSAPVSTTVTVKPLPDAVTITSAVYRTSKQRLDLGASSSVVSPNLVLTLQPYLTATGSMFTPPAPATLTNQGNGTYIATFVGVPEPAIPPATPIIITSNIGGSGVSGLTLIRQ